MVQNLVVHIGGRGASTTPIQRCLSQGHWASPGTTAFWPSGLGRTDAHDRYDSHRDLALALRPRAAQDRRDTLLAAARDSLAGSDADIGVISSGQFETLPPQALARAIRQIFPDHADSVRLIAYVTPHADQLLQSYCEQISRGTFHGTLQEFHDGIRDRGALRYHPRFARWRKVFGDRFSLRPMIRDRLHQQDVLRDFLHWMLQGATFDLTPPPPADAPPLPLRDLALLRDAHLAMNGTKNPGRRKRNLARHLAEQLRLSPAEDRSPLRLHRALAEDLADSYRDDAEALDAEFFEGSPMAGALRDAPQDTLAGPQSILAEDHFPPEELRIMRAWAAMAKRVI